MLVGQAFRSMPVSMKDCLATSSAASQSVRGKTKPTKQYKLANQAKQANQVDLANQANQANQANLADYPILCRQTIWTSPTSRPGASRRRPATGQTTCWLAFPH